MHYQVQYQRLNKVAISSNHIALINAEVTSNEHNDPTKSSGSLFLHFKYLRPVKT